MTRWRGKKGFKNPFKTGVYSGIPSLLKSPILEIPEQQPHFLSQQDLQATRGEVFLVLLPKPETQCSSAFKGQRATE